MIEITETKNEEIEKYLSNSFMAHGIEQMNGEEPVKAFCSFKDRKGSLLGAVTGYKTLNLFFYYIFICRKTASK